MGNHSHWNLLDTGRKTLVQPGKIHMKLGRKGRDVYFLSGVNGLEIETKEISPSFSFLHSENDGSKMFLHNLVSPLNSCLLYFWGLPVALWKKRKLLHTATETPLGSGFPAASPPTTPPPSPLLHCSKHIGLPLVNHPGPVFIIEGPMHLSSLPEWILLLLTYLGESNDAPGGDSSVFFNQIKHLIIL